MDEEQLWQDYCDLFIGDVEELVMILGLLDALQAPIAAEEGCIHPPHWPCKSGEEIDPSNADTP